MLAGADAGEVPEWLIGPVSKTGVVARSPRVRIPPSPFTPYRVTSNLETARGAQNLATVT